MNESIDHFLNNVIKNNAEYAAAFTTAPSSPAPMWSKKKGKHIMKAIFPLNYPNAGKETVLLELGQEYMLDEIVQSLLKFSGEVAVATVTEIYKAPKKVKYTKYIVNEQGEVLPT